MLILTLSLALAFPPLSPAAGFDHTHAKWTAVLEQNLHGDRFDYAAVARNRVGLNAYLAEIVAVTPAELTSWTREQRYAFWINTYNAHTIDLVAREWPVKSIVDIGGFFSPVWDKRFIALAPHDPGRKNRVLSLADIEHEILRPRFKDARVHAAINCASIGCPPLRGEAFVAERLEAQLDEQVRSWLADTSRNRFDRSKATMHVSEIFKWFDEDFERDAGDVNAWIARYAPPAEADWLKSVKKVKRKYVDYDWKVNAYSPPARKP